MNTSNIETAGKLNLLLVTSSLYFGGAQKVTSILANGLSQQHNVTVAYCFDSGRSHLFSENINIHKLPEYNKETAILKKLKCIRMQKKNLKVLKKELDIDAAVSLGNIANLINVLSRTGEQLICSERTNPKKSWGRLGFLIRFLYYRSDYIVFQSEKIRNYFGYSIRKKSCILKNPVLIPAPAYDNRKRKIVALGRLTAQKNHSLLIKSFAQFHKRFPEYSLHIYGEGELEKQMKELIESLEMSDHIFLEGNDPDVHERIRDAEMFVLSSNFEGLSNALLECMAMGIACISTKCEGSVDVIRNGENGLLIDIGDEKALTQAMCSLAADQDFRRKLEQKAKSDIVSFDKGIVVKDWDRVIRKCVLSDKKNCGMT